MASTVSYKIISIDLTIQIFGLFFNFVAGIAVLSTIGKSIDGLYPLATSQSIIGLYQFTTAWGHYFRPNILLVIKRRRGIHLGISSLLVLGIFVELETNLLRTFVENFIESGRFIVFLLFMVIIPQILAHYYLLITYQDHQMQEKQLGTQGEEMVF
jgi:hypothetical protein